ncbi:MAG: hypothetical protein JJE19_00925 [Methanosarcinales archaeon]|nr:hypothetical protein [Methanosarcinales archaeon]
MTNGNVELWIQVAAVIVALAGAFGGAYFGAKKSHDLEVQRRKKEEEEKVNDFKESTLLQLLWYASELASNKLALSEISEYEDGLKDLLISLSAGNASTLYYSIPKNKRDDMDIVLKKLSSKEYEEAKDLINKML